MEDDSFLPRLIFSDEAKFHLSGKVNRHNVRIWGTQNPRETVEHERDSPKVDVFVPFLKQKFTVLTFSREKQSDDFIFQQDGAPPHWYQQVRDFLNASLPEHWIGRTGPQDLALHFRPPKIYRHYTLRLFFVGVRQRHVFLCHH
jgi:hypothetical protein